MAISSTPFGGRCRHCIPKQVFEMRIPHNGMYTTLHIEHAVVDHPPHHLAPLPARASEDATGVHPTPSAATALFVYGAAIAALGGGGGPGQGLDLPAQILGLGLPGGGAAMTGVGGDDNDDDNNADVLAGSW